MKVLSSCLIRIYITEWRAFPVVLSYNTWLLLLGDIWERNIVNEVTMWCKISHNVDVHCLANICHINCHIINSSFSLENTETPWQWWSFLPVPSEVVFVMISWVGGCIVTPPSQYLKSAKQIVLLNKCAKVICHHSLYLVVKNYSSD